MRIFDTDVVEPSHIEPPQRGDAANAAEARQVEAMAGYGIPEPAIARVLEIDPAELRRRYRKELDNGQVKANAKVAENLYRKATGDGREAVPAAIFWLKTRAGWKETLVSEVTHDVADPIATLMQRIAEQGRAIHDRRESLASGLTLAAPPVGPDAAPIGGTISAPPIEKGR